MLEDCPVLYEEDDFQYGRVIGSRCSGCGRTYIVLGQETGAELQVVVQVERPSSLEPRAEGSHRRSLSELSHTFYASKLALGVLGGHFGSSPRASAVVVIRRLHVCSGTVVSMLLLLVEKCRHSGAVVVNDTEETEPLYR